jgi:Flp pilus assembly protein TadG
MKTSRKGLRRALWCFGRKQEGSVTVEFVLWLPVFMGIMLLSADASLMFLRQSNFWSVSRDTARIVSRHGLDTYRAELYAEQMAKVGTYTPDVTVRVDPITSTVTVQISGEAQRLAPFGIMSFAVGDRISAEVTQTLEPI